MANSVISTVVLLLLIVTTTTTTKAAGAVISNDDHEEDYVISSREVDHRDVSPEKLTHFRLYWQNDATPTPNATDVTIVPQPSNSSSSSSVGSAFFFGSVHAIDDPLTAGPSLNSTTVARAEGIYAPASQHDLAMLMVLNFAFLRGRYNGSTLAVLGRNRSSSRKARELTIVGGSGVFRMARGYVLLTTYFYDMAAGIAVVEYNIHVSHY